MRHYLLTCAALTCGLSLNAHAAAPKVAVDIAPLHSLVSQVMDGVDKPNLLIPAEASPHSHTLRPSEAKALADADVVFWIGEGLTPWLEKAMDNLADSAEKVEMLEVEGTTTYAFREGATFEGHDHGDHEEEGHHDDHDDHKGHDHDEHHDDHDDHKGHDHDKHHDDHDDHKGHDHDEHHNDHDDHKGHDHGDHHDHEGNDPHAWLDPANAKVWLSSIAATLSKKDPDNASKYKANAAKASAAMDALIASTEKKIDALGQPKFIVFHDAYQYFENRFGISAAGSISLSDAEDPSPARIKEIQQTVKKLKINCVFTEPQYDPGLVKNVFEGTDVSTIGVMDPLGANLSEGKGHYTALIEGMVKSVSECK